MDSFFKRYPLRDQGAVKAAGLCRYRRHHIGAWHCEQDTD
jgi:hypothetical protein